MLDKELEKAHERLLAVKESEMEEKKVDSLEQIKGEIIFTRQGELENINSLEKVEQIENSDKNTKER